MDNQHFAFVAFAVVAAENSCGSFAVVVVVVVAAAENSSGSFAVVVAAADASAYAARAWSVAEN